MTDQEPSAAASVDRLTRAFDEHHVLEFSEFHLEPGLFRPVLGRVAAEGSTQFRVEEAARSFGNRPLMKVTAGTGPTRVLLWSQMHGDESTATKALTDLLRFIAREPDDPLVRLILDRLTLTIVPMLNPDGAAVCARRTGQGIDMNRDALALRTPEARFLNALAGELRPSWAFNLHDQELSTVGGTREISALSVLAPAADPGRSDTPARTAAKRLAARAALTAHALAPGRIAKYDDGFEPRAFGDNFQKRGIGTLLVESGHMKGDPVKHAVRKLTFTVVADALWSLASAGSGGGGTEFYDRLPFNGKRAYDVIVRNVAVREGDEEWTADLGISRQVDTHPEGPPRLVDAGDLSIFSGLEEFDAAGAAVRRGDLRLNEPFDYLELAGR